ncbi:MAG TPA: serine/threonine-protein kinase, partial [Kofleriaceae bacterium]|nr:serine/threonine-protein kinase [Kofleriaceae bacterium]
MIAIGEQLGRYRVTRFLGAGGMGEVYEAHDPELGRAVAIKLLRADSAPIRLWREAQALAQLQHPNVVAVYDVGVANGRMYLAMEYVEGTTLDAAARARRGWRAIVALYAQAGEGLAAAHARSIVHRDFKPANVLVDRAGRVRVTDFGLARLDSSESDAASAAAISADSVITVDAAPGDADTIEVSTPRAAALDAPLTHEGAVVGTPRYMAPEQRAGAVATARSDQYAFCVSLWEALFGATDAPARDAPRWLVRALERGRAEAATDRHGSMRALLAILVGTPVKRRRVAIGGAAFLVVAGGAVAFAMVPRGGGAGIECANAGVEIESAWTPSSRARIGDAFARARPYGADVAARVGGGLDAYAHAWRDARIDACRATHERGEQSAAMLDRRAACLDDGLYAVRALVPRLEAADGKTVDRAVDSIAALPEIAACEPARLATAGAP